MAAVSFNVIILHPDTVELLSKVLDSLIKHRKIILTNCDSSSVCIRYLFAFFSFSSKCWYTEAEG